MVTLTKNELDNLVQEDRVHRRVYADPDLFDMEMEKIFGRAWVYMGHESEIANAGDYKANFIGQEPVILSRHRDGTIHVLFNRCAHRAGLVCRDEVGNANRFRCPYHGWTYRNNGELLGVPFRDAYPPDFDTSQLRLGEAARVDTYHGFIWASLSPTGPNLDEYLGGFKKCIDDIYDFSPSGEIIVPHVAHRYFFKGNWKFQLENIMDFYHPPFSHESNMLGRGKLTVGRKDAAFRPQALGESDKPSADQGRIHAFYPYGHGYNENVARPRSGELWERYAKSLEERLGPEKTDEVLNKRWYIGNTTCYPNVSFKEKWQIRVVRPVRPDMTEITVYPIVLKGAPQEYIEEQIMDLNVQASASSFQQTDDLEMFARNQEGLSTKSGLQWLILARGLHREEDGEVPGERVSPSTDELVMRAMHSAWKHWMGQP